MSDIAHNTSDPCSLRSVIYKHGSNKGLIDIYPIVGPGSSSDMDYLMFNDLALILNGAGYIV